MSGRSRAGHAMRDALKLVACLAGCQLAGIAGGLLTRPGLGGWYRGLDKPPLTPPDAAFGVVWPLLYGLMGLAAWLVWRRGLGAPGVRGALGLFLAQLTHVGKYQGRVVAANILGEPREATYDAVPRVAFTDPQAASVGAAEATFSATVPISEVAKTASYTRAYDESNGFITLLSDGERLTGAYALGPEAGEWLQQATLAIRARVPLEVLRDTIQPFPAFSEIYIAALNALHGQITAARQPVGAATLAR